MENNHTSNQTTNDASQSKGLTSNVLAALSYFFFWIGLFGTKDKFLKFHSLQSAFLTFGALISIFGLTALGIMMELANFPGETLVSLLVVLLLIGYFILLVLGILKAYQEERWLMPVIGKWADRFSK